MKDIIVFVLSELFLFGIALGVILIAHPGISLLAAAVGAIFVYIFATVVSIILNFILKYAVNKYFDWKDSKDE